MKCAVTSIREAAECRLPGRFLLAARVIPGMRIRLGGPDRFVVAFHFLDFRLHLGAARALARHLVTCLAGGRAAGMSGLTLLLGGCMVGVSIRQCARLRDNRSGDRQLDRSQNHLHVSISSERNSVGIRSLDLYVEAASLPHSPSRSGPRSERL